MSSASSLARLVGKVRLTNEISSFRFAAIERPFGDCEPGGHIDVELGNELIRNYSLTDWDSDGTWLQIAVKRESEGRGGSLAMHELEVGDVATIGGPRNNFPLRSDDEPIILLAGGIGVTPIYAMAQALAAGGKRFEVHYVVRSRRSAALHAALMSLGIADRYRLHCADEEGRPDIGRLLEDQPRNVHLYVCGPEGMLAAAHEATQRAGKGTVFFERFAATPEGPPAPKESFHVILSSTGQELMVPADQSILQTLRSAGVDLDYACSEGVCGTCIVDVVDGEIDHRDSILTSDEQLAGDCMCICVSRAKSDRLVLAL